MLPLIKKSNESDTLRDPCHISLPYFSKQFGGARPFRGISIPRDIDDMRGRVVGVVNVVGVLPAWRIYPQFGFLPLYHVSGIIPTAVHPPPCSVCPWRDGQLYLAIPLPVGAVR